MIIKPSTKLSLFSLNQQAKSFSEVNQSFFYYRQIIIIGVGRGGPGGAGPPLEF